MTNQQTELKTIMDFHGIKLPVVTHDGIEYVPLRPIITLLDLDWRRAKSTAFNGDNAVLYGTKLLLPPVIALENEPRLTQEIAFIMLKRVFGYLCRINTNQMRVQGNVLGAEYLLKLQEEWADALYQYETTGIAIKQSKSVAHRELSQLLRMRSQCKGTAEHNAISNMIKNCFIELGEQMPEDQQQSLSFGAQP